MPEEKDKYNLWIEPYICSFHRNTPGVDFAGCSCCSGYGMHPKNPQEFYDANKDIGFNALEDLLLETP